MILKLGQWTGDRRACTEWLMDIGRQRRMSMQHDSANANESGDCESTKYGAIGFGNKIVQNKPKKKNQEIPATREHRTLSVRLECMKI